MCKERHSVERQSPDRLLLRPYLFVAITARFYCPGSLQPNQTLSPAILPRLCWRSAPCSLSFAFLRSSSAILECYFLSCQSLLSKYPGVLRCALRCVFGMCILNVCPGMRPSPECFKYLRCLLIRRAWRCITMSNAR